MNTIKATMATAAMATMATVDAATITGDSLSCRLLTKTLSRAGPTLAVRAGQMRAQAVHGLDVDLPRVDHPAERGQLLR
jgi:hypothetical protein